MIVLGLMGRPDRYCHDAAACLIIDGRVVGALEQERVSRRRHAWREGPEGAVRALLEEHKVHPSRVEAVGYAWADAPDGARIAGSDPCEVKVTGASTSAILPTLGDRLGTSDVFFFDHHLCHAAGVYYLNPHPAADILVADGWGGDGSTSLFHVDRGRFRLLERYEEAWSLGLFYATATVYAGMGWYGQGKFMGLGSYGRPTGRRFMSFDPAAGRFEYTGPGRWKPTNDLDDLSAQWLENYQEGVFPHTQKSSNQFDYAPFAADVQATLEELGLGLAARLRRLSGEDTLLLSGGVALNAQMNSTITRTSGYASVASTVAPNDAGTVFGAAFLAQALMGEEPALYPRDAPPPIFFGPEPSASAIQEALRARSLPAEAHEGPALRREVAAALGAGEIVAWYDGRNEFGPRALGARSLLASPGDRAALDRLNLIKGREAWRPAALSLTGDGFEALNMEPPVSGLSDYMLCTHAVAEDRIPAAVAGVHVDYTSRAQYVPHSDDGFGALLAELGERSGLPAVVNTSLNTRGEPMALTPEHAVSLFEEVPEIDVLAMPPYLVRRPGDTA